MKIKELFNDKSIKPKVKTETLCKWLLDKTISDDELFSFAQIAKDSQKATCIEAIEFATKKHPDIANEKYLQFVTSTLNEKAPRVKWESAKVIGNIAHRFPTKLNDAITNLLNNSEHNGTVVRWATAYALGEILILNTNVNKELLPAVEALIKREDQNSIIKVYHKALKVINTKN